MSAKTGSLKRLVQRDGILQVSRTHLWLSLVNKLSIFTGYLQCLAHWAESQQRYRNPTSACEPNGARAESLRSRTAMGTRNSACRPHSRDRRADFAGPRLGGRRRRAEGCRLDAADQCLPCAAAQPSRRGHEVIPAAPGDVHTQSRHPDAPL